LYRCQSGGTSSPFRGKKKEKFIYPDTVREKKKHQPLKRKGRKGERARGRQPRGKVPAPRKKTGPPGKEPQESLMGEGGTVLTRNGAAGAGIQKSPPSLTKRKKTRRNVRTPKRKRKKKRTVPHRWPGGERGQSCCFLQGAIPHTRQKKGIKRKQQKKKKKVFLQGRPAAA